jgi:hypothetical protein
MNDLEGAQANPELAALLNVTREDLAAAAESVRSDVLEFSAPHLIANLILHAVHAQTSMGRYEFPEVEFASLICWHRANDDPTARPPSGRDVERISRELGHLFFMMDRYYAAQEHQASVNQERADLAHRLRSSGLRIRGRAYAIHEQRVLRGLFGPFDAELASVLGFSIENVIRVLSEISDLMLRGFHRFRSDRPADASLLDAHFESAGDYFTFGSATLVASTGVDRDVADRILAAFSLPRGGVDKHGLLPSPFSILRERPILAVGDGTYLVPSLALLLPAVQSRIENMLNPDVAREAPQGLWKRYERHRGSWVELESGRLIRGMMPGGSGVVGAYYDTPDGRRVEGDVVYQVDDAVFLAEGKAAAFTPPSLRGAGDRLDSDVRTIITKGHDQAARTEAFITGGGRTFLDEHGKASFTLAGKLREVFRIVVTLDSVGALGTAAAVLQRGRYMTGAPTWVVSLTDLMIISEGMAVPGEFRHYMRRRYAALLDERVITFDEIDLLGIYQVHNEMDFAEAEADTILVELARVIRALANAGGKNWTQAACDLLDLGNKSRTDIAEMVRRRISMGIDEPHDVGCSGGDGAWSITIVMMANMPPMSLLQMFVASISHPGRAPASKRLIIAWDPIQDRATADYFHKVEDRYYRVPPALVWKSNLTRS